MRRIHDEALRALRTELSDVRIEEPLLQRQYAGVEQRGALKRPTPRPPARPLLTAAPGSSLNSPMSSTIARLTLGIALLGTLTVAAPTTAGQVTFHGGSRTSSDLDGAFVLGVDALLGPADWPVAIDLGAFVSESEGEVFTDVSTREISVGALKSWPIGRGPFAAYVGGGASWIEVEASTFFFGGASDGGINTYLRGGTTWSPRTLVLGVDLRVGEGAEADLGFEQLDLGYRQVAFSAGWRW